PRRAARLVDLDAPVAVQVIAARTARHEYIVRAETATLVEASTFYYPGWKLEIDGRGESIGPAGVTGTIQFRVAAGGHIVVLALRPTGTRRVAILISIVALLGVLMIAAAGAVSSRPGPH